MKNSRQQPCATGLRGHDDISAFSLVEVVLSLGLVSVVLISLLSLTSVGLEAKRDSDQRVVASNCTLILGSQWRSLLLNTNYQGSPISFTLGATNTGSFYVLKSGRQTTDKSSADFRLIYQNYVPTDRRHPALLWMRLSWPAQASPDTNAGNYETVISHLRD